MFWGWYVMLGAFLILGVSYGARYCLGIFVKPMSEDYGWSRTVISSAASIMIFIYGIGGIFSGRLLDHTAPRWILTAGAVLIAAGFILVAFVKQPWQFFLAYGLLCGLGSACFGAVVCSTTISKWFVRKRGFAIGLASIGTGLGTMLLVPLTGEIVIRWGWQAGFIFLGVLTLVIGLAASQIFMGKTKPEDYGLLPDGDQERPGGADPAPDDVPGKLSLKPLLADNRFWYLTVSYGLAVMVWASVSVHQVAYALDRGIDALSAATAVGFIGVASIAGRFFFGSISDRVKDAKYLAAWGFITMASALTVLLFAETEGLLYLYAILFGFGYGAMAPLMPFLLADRFGRHIMGSAYGLMIFFTAGIGGGIGPFLGGVVYDLAGSYDYAWGINILALVFVAFLILKVKAREKASRY